jgi:hypothetical protein
MLGIIAIAVLVVAVLCLFELHAIASALWTIHGELTQHRPPLRKNFEPDAQYDEPKAP